MLADWLTALAVVAVVLAVASVPAALVWLLVPQGDEEE